MAQLAIADIFLASVVFLLAGAVKGVLGMGLPTVAIGLLGLVMPVPAAASLLTVPSLVTNVWQAAAGGRLALLLRRLWPLQAGIAVGLLGAGPLLAAHQDSAGRMLLGVCLLLYGVLGWFGWQPRQLAPGREGPVGLAAGLATGVITSLTGVFVLPAVPYLQALRLGKEPLSQALGVSFTTSTLALGILLAAQGHLGAQASLQSLLMVLPAMAGMWFGQHIRHGMSEATFRRCFFGGLTALGAWLLWRWAA